MAYSSFEELDVWKRSRCLAVRIYEMLKDCRDFGLKDQMTRSAVSISSNIAEGCERDSVREFIRYLHIAKGSSAELRSQVYIASDVALISNGDSQAIVDELRVISRMLHKLITALKRNLGT